MISRLVIPGLTTITVMVATGMIWKALHAEEMKQLARIVELESYAARSRLVQNVDVMLRALRDAQSYWSRYGRLPRDQWAEDAEIELSHFDGIDFIIWNDSSRSVRYVRNAENPVLDYRPSDSEWDNYRGLIAEISGLSGDSIMGPRTTEDGDTVFEVYFIPENVEENGTLIAQIDTHDLLGKLFENDSPEYAITVRWGDQTIYQRDESHPGLPGELRREGKIKNLLGSVWTIEHAPTQDLFNSMRSAAVDAVLFAGIIIALLLGLVMFGFARARRNTVIAVSEKDEVSIANQHLERLVARRTRDLEERSADLVTITDSVGHDLRNPLNAISANNQLLEQQFGSQLGQDGLEILQQTAGCVDGMTDILDRLLNLSVVSTSQFSRERVDLKALAMEIMEELLHADPEPPVDFKIGDVPDAFAEPLMVRTLLMNLISNALKYSRNERVRVIEFSSRWDDSGICVYLIRDNGQGFEAEDAKKLFEAFERFDHSDEVEGMGLGLDIASRVVRRHAGKIWAEGATDEGATFYFTLGEKSKTD